MISILETIAIAMRLIATSAQEQQKQEQALMQAEERLALMRKRAKFRAPGA